MFLDVEEEAFQEFMQKYDAFTARTYNGSLGSTAEFWLKYIDLVLDWQMFARACKTNDVNLFIYALHRMVPLFFACNKPNYARWMTMFVIRLTNIDHTHPGLKEILQKGALSIRRSSHSFSRSPVDLTLEQTINQDAASRLTGISAFQHSESAKSRWAITRSARSAIISSLMEKVGIKKCVENDKSLRKERVNRDQADSKKLKDGIQGSYNPFDPPESVTKNELFNSYWQGGF